MPGHIDKTGNNLRSVVFALKDQGRKTQIGCHLPLSLFFETVGIDAGQSPQQACLAVVDMAGRGQSEMSSGQFFHSR
ncbi:MAG: hypothetical protein BWY75_03813 [bacterium ADurb.Bin425]|nr:MAG: hypothetical protein BWY75_03813 [bacterium ADurb.Bin425]